MRRMPFFAVFASMVLLIFSCSVKKESGAAGKKAQEQGARPSQTVQVPPAAVFLHYRLPKHHAALKKILEPLTGPSIQFVWPHVESVQSFSAWIFEMPKPVPGKFSAPRFVACLKGKATEWLYTGILSGPDGKTVTFEKDRVVPVAGPQGAHDTYYLMDRGQHACLGSTEALARDAMGWAEPSGWKADAFLKLRMDVSLLSEMFRDEAFAPMLASLKALWSLYRIDPDQAAKLVAAMDALDLELGMNEDVVIRQRYELSWKNPPAFLQKPRTDRIPFTAQTLIDLHFEMNGGRWMGIDVWPFIEAQNPPREDGFAGQLEAFVKALESVDFQLASDGSRVGARVVLSAPGQADFLVAMTRKMLDEAARGEKASVKPVPALGSEQAWEIHPTAETDSDVRDFLKRYAGGLLRLSCRQTENGVISWTLGEFPEAGESRRDPEANARLSFSLIPFFNLFLPFMEEQSHASEPRFVPYPSVEQDPWMLELTLQPERRVISAEGRAPLGAWMRAMQKYPEIFRRIQKSSKDKPASKPKQESDL